MGSRPLWQNSDLNRHDSADTPKQKHWTYPPNNFSRGFADRSSNPQANEINVCDTPTQNRCGKLSWTAVYKPITGTADTSWKRLTSISLIHGSRLGGKSEWLRSCSFIAQETYDIVCYVTFKYQLCLRCFSNNSQ